MAQRPRISSRSESLCLCCATINPLLPCLLLWTGTRSPWPVDRVRCPTLSFQYSSGLATSTQRSIHWFMPISIVISERLSATLCSACSATGGRIAICHSTSIYDARVCATISVPRVSTRKVTWTRIRPRIADNRNLSIIYNIGTRRCWRPLRNSSSV